MDQSPLPSSPGVGNDPGEPCPAGIPPQGDAAPAPTTAGTAEGAGAVGAPPAPDEAKKKLVLRWVEQVLWAAGTACLAVVLYVVIDAHWFAWVQGRRLDAALQARAAASASDSQEAGSDFADSRGPAAPSASQSDNLASFHDGSAAPSAAGSAATPLDEGELIGRVVIPRLGLSSLVLQGVTDGTLRRGVGHIPNTALPGMAGVPGGGNIGLAGHRDTSFRGLGDVRQGDEIQLETLGGSYRYVVDWSRIVDPTDVIVLAASNRPELTLVTCYPFHYVGSAPQRFIVRAHQVGGDGAGPAATPGG